MLTNSHQQRMQAKKRYIDNKIKQANREKSIIVLLTGNGKGKSSSALGMIIRSLGWGQKVVLVSFLKGAIETGEKLFLTKLPNLISIEMATGFTWETQNKDLDTKQAQKTWQQAQQYLQDATIDLIVFDELTYMLNYNYLHTDIIIEQIMHRTPKQNVIITGRSASRKLKNIADTVSAITNEKHAFDNNIKAVKGIDW